MTEVDENRGACVATGGPRAFFGAVVTVILLASCTADNPEQASTPPPDTIRATAVTTQPTTSTTKPVDEFIDLCVDYILLSSYLGDEESRVRWDGAGQDKSQLRAGCQTIAETEPATRSTLEQRMEDLDAFFVATEAEEKRQERERAAAQAEEDRKVRAYLEAVAEAEEQKKVDDYLRAVAAANAAQEKEAERQGGALVDRMCGGARGWYWYEINPVRVWLDRCERQVGTGSGGGGGGDDLDCEDFGYEFEIDPNNDPHGLDGDGDGIACEGW